MPPELLLGGVLLAALVLYFLLGGADFGGGVWDLLAFGPRRDKQRALIEHAIGPVWEANHVWLILAAVVLFGGFPRAFAAISIAMHVPLTLFLLGVVFRGSAFVFRAYGGEGEQKRRWGQVFSAASVVAPCLLGVTVGALASGGVRVEAGVVTSGFFQTWLRPFPLVTGLFSLSLCALLAATYLAYEADAPALQADFRRRALASHFVTGALALVALLLSKQGAPLLYEGLTGRAWTWPFHAATAVCALVALWSQWTRRYGLSRVAVGGLVALVLLGWALSQYPYLVPPSLTLSQAVANPRTARAILWALALGAPILLPSLWLLFRVFKGPRGRGPGA